MTIVNWDDFYAITSQYIYGSTEKPENLATNGLIRDEENTTVQILTSIYMTVGAGRFAKASMSSLVEQFFNNESYSDLPELDPGTYSKSDLEEIYDNHSYSINLKQTNYSDDIDDIGIRTYIWNSTAFQLGDVQFVVAEDGTRHIKNMSIMPRFSVTENFDFESDSRLAELAADYLQDRMDVSRIGKKVILDFVGSAPVVATYDINDFYVDVVATGNSYSSVPNLSHIYDQVYAILDSLWTSGVTAPLDERDRLVLYGTNDSDILTSNSIGNGNYSASDNPFFSQYLSNGFVLVAGDGNDRIIGTVNSDVIMGGKGNDTLVGGDTYFTNIGTYTYHSEWNDHITDTLKGGMGYDTYLISGSYENYTNEDVGMLDVIDIIDETGGDGRGNITVQLGPDDWLGLLRQTKGLYTLNYEFEGGAVYNNITFSPGEIISDWDVSVRVSNMFDEDGNRYVFIDQHYPDFGESYVAIKGFRNGDFGIVLVDYDSPKEGSQNDDEILNLGPQGSLRVAQSTSPNSVYLTTNPESDQRIHAGEGNDIVYGRGGDDDVRGDEGDDSLFGNEGNDLLMGGTGSDVLEGGVGNDELDGGSGIDTMIGGTGNDVYIVDNVDDDTIEVGGTDTVESSITWTLAAELERLTLTGSGTINGTGNNLANILTGNSAANVLNGSSGADTMVGGAGNDAYVVDDAGDVTTEEASSGTDTVQSSINWALATELERLTLTGTGAINGTGNTLANTLTGNSGANTLDGGTGADLMTGGAGNDIYIVDNTGDDTTELSGGGTDTVQTSISWTLDTELEKLILTGTAAINGTGNTLANTLTGNSGNNILDGGTGVDTMIGGAGNDTYVVSVATDVITEISGGGTDTVQSSVTLTLGTELENLTLTGTAAINGTGNTLANTLTGNSGANTLTGGDGNDTLNGAGGNDTMVGGLGNDIYVVASTGDVVTEAASGGTDTVQSSITWTLGANVEKLTLTGTAAINGTGNTLGNALTGNTGANTLNGGDGNDTLNGGGGTDKLVGGLGNDTYVVDTSTDVVTEASGGGTDTIQSSITWSISSLANVERITLTGTAAINATGNASTNILTGNNAVNILSAGAGKDTLRGGIGNDILTGGIGSDTFVFATGDDKDTINDFTASGTTHDIIDLSDLTTIISYSDLTSNHMTQSGANVLIDGLNGDTITITIKNVTLASLASTDFLF